MYQSPPFLYSGINQIVFRSWGVSNLLERWPGPRQGPYNVFRTVSEKSEKAFLKKGHGLGTEDE